MTVSFMPETEHINAVAKQQYQTKIYATLEVEGQKVQFQLDTGATCNVVSKSDLAPHVLIEPTCGTLRLFDASSLRPLGKCNAAVVNPKTGARYRSDFVVVHEHMKSLLGARCIQEMDLMTVRYENILQMSDDHNSKKVGPTNSGPARSQILSKYVDVFDGQLGHLPGELHLDVDSSIKPVQLPVRRIPVAVRDELINEFARMEDMGVIARVDEPTEWISALVAVRKPSGKLRVCIDPKPLNQALKRQHYPMTTIDDLLPSSVRPRYSVSVTFRMGFGM